MDNARRQALLETMKKINKEQGNFMDFAENSSDTDVIKSGIPSFDKFIGGGIKKGNFTVGWGSTGCGKSTLCLQIIAAAQKAGQLCVYIDMEHTFEKDRARNLGVNLKELVLVNNCQTAEDAEEIVRTIAKDKVADLAIVDSIQAMSPKGEQENKGKERDLAGAEMAQLARTLSKFFRVVSPDVFRAKLAVLLIGQCRMSLGSFIVRADLSGGEALKHWSYQTIFMRRGQGADAPSQKVVEYYLDPDGKMHKESKNIPCGFDAVLKLTKTKSSSSAVENSEIHVPFTFERGFVESLENQEEQIKIEGTLDEQMKIRKLLIEKGVLKDSTTVRENSTEPTLVPPTIEVNERKFTKEEVKVLDKPKKRGRPAKK